MNKRNEDVSLLTSLERVKQDIRAFTAFKKQFNEEIQRLSDEAMKVIGNCVKTHIGQEQFKSTRIAREASKEKWLDKKQIYDAKSLKLDEELDKLCRQRAMDRAAAAKLKY